MCLGNYSRFKRVILCLLLCHFFYVQTVQAYAPIVVGGRILLTRVLGNVVARRAVASVAANDAIIGLRAMQTYRALGTVAANDARFALGTTSTLRHAKDISWVGLALASGAITLSDLNVSGNDELNITFEPTAVKLTDGRYAIQINGETKVVTSQPSQFSPVIYTYLSTSSKQIEDSEVKISDDVNNQYKYYGELYDGSYAQSNSLEKLAEYLAQEKFGGKNQENYTEVEVNGELHRYLSSKTEVTHTYLRHTQIGDSIHFTVRQHFKYYNLKYSFRDEISGVTSDGKWISSFNSPSESDYDVTEHTRSVDSSFDENEYFVGDFSTKPKEQQLGSIEDINSGLLYGTKPLTAQQLAMMYNALLLSAASQVGYDGVPFSSTNPVTATEVAQSLSELGLNPTYADLFTKAGVGDEITFDVSLNSSSSPSGNTNPNRNDDLTENVEVSDLITPELEPPTARQILEPFNRFFPTLKNINIHHSAQCPKWSIDIPFIKFSYELKEHCTLIEEQRSFIESIFSVIWALVALRILLSA